MGARRGLAGAGRQEQQEEQGEEAAAQQQRQVDREREEASLFCKRERKQLFCKDRAKQVRLRGGGGIAAPSLVCYLR